MKLGLSTAAFYGLCETEEAAGRVAALPLDCAEVFLQTFSEYDAAFARDVRARLGALACTSVHAMGTQFENGMFSRSARQRRDSMDVFRRVLDAGAALGAGVYVYHGRFDPRKGALLWNARESADVYAAMSEEAARRGMAVAWENVSWCQMTCEARVREIRALLPQARFTLDVKQAMRSRCDPLALARAMGGAIANVHVCDWDETGRLRLPGEGAFDFGTLFALLRAQGYAGAVVLEPYLSLIEDEDKLLRSIAFLRRAMGEEDGR